MLVRHTAARKMLTLVSYNLAFGLLFVSQLLGVLWMTASLHFVEYLAHCATLSRLMLLQCKIFQCMLHMADIAYSGS